MNAEILSIEGQVCLHRLFVDSFQKSCSEAWRRSSSPLRCFTRALMLGLTYCVAGRLGMSLGGGPACSWTLFQSRSRISRLTLTNAPVDPDEVAEDKESEHLTFPLPGK
ncbi:hypothetical protein, partial [Mesorhizobium sp.]|uniref:hypothetical protein n=1 Tax=Mesorhizobium sp. TaxID=1871066 RepID=UPI0025DF2035